MRDYQTTDEAKKRYNAKLDKLRTAVDDPYATMPSAQPGHGYDTDGTLNQQLWAKVEYPGIINTPRPCTKEQLKAYKSLEGYKYHVDSWVSKVFVCQIKFQAGLNCFAQCMC